MANLSQRQQDISLRKLDLEKEIMAKQGVDDAETWIELRKAQETIDAMAQEKLMLIAKLYNLTQKFVQELDIVTEETNKQMQQSGGQGRSSSSYNEMMSAVNFNSMRF